MFKHLLVWVSRALLCFQCSLQVTIRTTSELKHSHTRSPLPVSLSLSLFSLPVPPSGLGPRACFGVYCFNTDNCMCAKLLQLCLTFCDPKDSSLPGSSVHGILQARTLEWAAFPSPGDLPHPGVQCESSTLAGGFFITSATWEALLSHLSLIKSPRGRLSGQYFVKQLSRTQRG